jgi:hypothetical protein
VGSAFLVLSGVLFWQHKLAAFQVTALLGATLLIAGVLLPARLGPVYRGWMRLADLISRVTTPTFMAVVYFFVLTPIGLIMRISGWRPIEHQLQHGTFWRSRVGSPPSDLRRQF